MSCFPSMLQNLVTSTIGLSTTSSGTLMSATSYSVNRCHVAWKIRSTREGTWTTRTSSTLVCLLYAWENRLVSRYLGRYVVSTVWVDKCCWVYSRGKHRGRIIGDGDIGIIDAWEFIENILSEDIHVCACKVSVLNRSFD